MDILSALEMDFREILKAYGKERETLSPGDLQQIIKNVQDEAHATLSADEVQKLYQSFYQEWWRTHALPPRKGRDAA